MHVKGMLAANNNSESGSIVIGAQSHIVRNYLLEHVGKFRISHPNVIFKIIDLSTMGLKEVLQEHEIDFVIDSSPINSQYNNMKILPIYKLDTCFIKSKDSNVKIKKLSDLEGQCIVMLVARSSLRKMRIKYLKMHLYF